MYELPTLNDAQVLSIIGTHPDEFFETMKEFEPYTLICASATRLEIKPKSTYVDLKKLETTFEHLNRLGYHPEAHNGTYTKPNGEQVIDLDSITIDWEKHNKPEVPEFRRTDTNMKIEVDENDLIYLLKCADDAACFDEYERGFPDSAREARKRIHKTIFEINKTIGYPKWMYSETYGVFRNNGDGEDGNA